MIIRNYKDEDYQKLITLLKDAKLYYEVTDKRENFKKKIEHDPESIIIAEEDGKIIGVVFFVYDPWKTFVFHLAIDLEHRKKGIGSILLQIVEQRVRARGVAEAVGFVDEKNIAAIEFYKKNGIESPYRVIFFRKTPDKS